MTAFSSEDQLAEDERLGQAVYDRDIRPTLRPEDQGRYVAIDVKSGSYEIDPDDYAATGRLLERIPTARIWLMRGLENDLPVRPTTRPEQRMIRGTVNAKHEAILRVRVHGPSGSVADADAVIDTGFSGSLVLPPSVISELGLVRRSGGIGTLADGTVRRYDEFGAEVDWDGTRRGVVIAGVGRETLLGMGLLAGYELKVAVEPDGAVEVQALQRQNA